MSHFIQSMLQQSGDKRPKAKLIGDATGQLHSTAKSASAFAQGSSQQSKKRGKPEGETGLRKKLAAKKPRPPKDTSPISKKKNSTPAPPPTSQTPPVFNPQDAAHQ